VCLPQLRQDNTAMSVADWFLTFHSNLAITNGDDISYRYKRITGRLNTDFRDTTNDTANSIYVGSYGRDTGVGKVSDLDMAYQLPVALYQQYSDHAGNGQSALLQAVRNSIQKTYDKTSIAADGQVLVINFTDNVKFEILPCFPHSDGSSFIYPDSNAGGSWKVSNPRAEIAAIKTRNDATNSNLKRLCRMMRMWKDRCDVPMGGLLIDTLAYSFILNWEHKDKSFLYYDWMCRDFFKFMADGDRSINSWPAPGSRRAVTRSGLFEYKARMAENIAKEAIVYDSKQQHPSAKAKWREIFGPSFPA
jgi:Second Messenger Oligonucleotide or Dinucleotide Synthetase domain